MTSTKERFHGVDLAKIIAIFFVMVHHVSDCGLDVQSGNFLLSCVHGLLHRISYSCIDLFALATGFLCVSSSCRYSRIVSLWVSTVFWGVAVLLFSQFCLGYSIPFESWFNALFPVWHAQYWFFTAYFMLFFFMPCLNRSVKNMTQREFQHLLVAIGIFICGYSLCSEDLFSMRRGYSFPWLCIVYLMGAYLRIYPPRKQKPRFCFSMAFLIAFVACLLRFVERQLLPTLSELGISGDRFVMNSYVSPFTLGVAIMIFLGCLNMTIGDKVGRFLKTTAATTFGIYLIHVQPFVWQNIWHANLHKIKVDSPIELVSLVLAISTVTFVGFAILEHCRLKLFAILGIDNLIQKVDTFIKRPTLSETAQGDIDHP